MTVRDLAAEWDSTRPRHTAPAAALTRPDVIHLTREQLLGQHAGPDVDVDGPPVRMPDGLHCLIWWHDHIKPWVAGVTFTSCTTLIAVIDGPHAKAAQA